MQQWAMERELRGGVMAALEGAGIKFRVSPPLSCLEYRTGGPGRPSIELVVVSFHRPVLVPMGFDFGLTHELSD